MKKMKVKLLVVGLLLFSGLVQANGKVVRFRDMSTSMRSELIKGNLTDVVIEFQQGDELPITFEAQGDLFETRQNVVSYVGVKQNFWLRPVQNNIEISLDGETFKKINEVLTGSLVAGAGSAQNGGVADAINIVFKAFLK